MPGLSILLINHYAGSPRHGMEFRPWYLAHEWQAQGHRVHVVAASASHVRSSQPATTANRTSELVDGVPYTWFRTPGYHGNGFRRVLNMLAFVLQLLWASRWLRRAAAPDVVIASSTYPLDIFPAWYIARRSGARLVFEVHDLWPLSPVQLGGVPRWHPYILL
ncbi:MAG: glycosyltransferase, partial [Dehalococcoidia bacterium]